ncbi:DUF3085 domain-containing protein [Vibrio alginolyticus]|uniref:DUF3085 domain-containing protein n=1 Tax=Vibrio alginolyticus TaxID=663 RepID=UPI00211A8E46|nr:DUF3085 domain-containing protein [Vibrio alginolyticus]MCQ9090613.1 DUF3085 domain-containing protein [Vibrio alginolyticus]
MAIVKFNMKEVQLLVDELNKTKSYSPTMDDLFKPALYKTGKVVDSNGNDEEHKDFGWPDSSQIDKSLVEPQLLLVKDQGLYLLNNADVKESPRSRGAVVYAHGCNPDKDDDFYETARMIFGGGDGSVSIPVGWFDLAYKANKRYFKLNVAPTQISLVLK